MRCTRSKVSASTRLLACSTNARFRPGRRRRAGSDLRSGACCATRHTEAGHVTARPSFVHASESRDRYGNATGWPAVIAPITNARARTGSRLPFPRWSAKRPSRWPKSSWSKTNGTRQGARLSRRCYRGCWFVSAGSIAPRHKPPHAGSTTTAALVPTRIVISKAPSATIHRFVRTSLMQWSGRRSCSCWKIPTSFKMS